MYEVDPDDDTRVYVKDPLRHQHHRFNILQVEMMRALDGKRSLEKVIELVEEELEVEISIEQVQRFIKRLERDLLLDVSSYRVDDARTRRAIVRRLRKRGLAWRIKARDDATHEAYLFEQAVHQAREGDPVQAASYFEAILEINPNNHRARESLACIHEAFFRSRRGVPSHLLMRHIWNPDRFLTALDRRVGRAVFSPWGMAAVALLILSAIPSILSVFSQPTVVADFSVIDGVVFLLVTLVGFVVHEVLGHGLACKHFGGRVEDVGLVLLYGVVPGAYCDVSDSYVFARRWHKMAVSLAGVPAHLVYQAILWHICATTSTSFPMREGILFAAVLSLLPTFQNFIPLVPLDGYHVLSDYLGIHNLRERSLQYVKDRLQVRVLGVPAGGVEPAARERRVFLVFGTLAAVYTVIWVYGIWISFLLPLATTYLGDFGLFLSFLYFANLLGRVFLKKTARFVRFVARERRVIFTRRRTTSLAIGVGVAIAILSIPWPLYVDGTMVVEPVEKVSVRATGAAGIVAEVKVSEGQHVEAGQVIAVLRSDELLRDRAIAAEKLAIAKLSLAQLEAGARPEELAMAAASARASRIASAGAAERLKDTRRLRRQGIGSGDALLQARAQAARAQGQQRLSGIEAQRIRAGARAEEIAQARAEVRQLEAKVASLKTKRSQLVLRSPIPGIVVGNDLRDRIGQWLAPGDSLCEVHNLSRWRALIIPGRGEPLGVLRPGQEVALRAVGDAHRLVDTELSEVLAAEGTVRLYTEEIPDIDWKSGMSGHARVYGPAKSIGYQLVAIPILRIVGYDLWRRF